MGREEQLRWERDNSRWAAIAAFVSAAVTIAASLYLRSKVQTGSDDDAVAGIKLVNEHKSDLLVSACLQALGTALLAVPLYYLFRATRARREQLPGAIKYLILIAPLLGAITAIVRQVQIAEVSDKIIPLLPLELQRAEDLIEDEVGQTGLVAVGGIATAAALGIAFMFILVSLNAMRAGLLSRFMGILGIIVGVLLVIPLQGDLPIVQVFWLGAIGVLILDKWPQGRGPAWAAVEPIPWPTAQDRRDELTGGERPQRPSMFGRPRPEPADDYEDEADEPDEEEVAHTREPARPRQSAPTHPRSKKRKRKRRG